MGWVIVTDTLCEGWQAWGEESGDVEVYETEADAQAEIDYTFDDLRRNQIESGMEPDQEPDAFAIPINEYTRGRKAVWARKN
tara:strand:+ start:2973 stop:3218 length:246 start_codon:yes stop_codon:yes gene_type:complete